MNVYELTLVLPGGSTAAKKKAVGETIEKIVKMNDGVVAKSDDWGEKELAYPIAKYKTGSFLHYDLELESVSVKALADKLRMEEGIIRHLLIKKEN